MMGLIAGSVSVASFAPSAPVVNMAEGEIIGPHALRAGVYDLPNVKFSRHFPALWISDYKPAASSQRI